MKGTNNTKKVMHVTRKCNNSEAPYPALGEHHMYEIRHRLQIFPQSLQARLPCIVQISKNIVLIILFYNIARVHPNLIPIGVIMVHFSTYARPCVHPMTCASQMGEACARCVILKKLLQRDNTIKNVFFIRAMKLNETLRLNQYEKPFSPFFYREFCN